MLSTFVLPGVAAMAAVLAWHWNGSVFSGVFSWQALCLVTLYTGLLVLAEYSPGRCLYRILVLASPRKHLALELEKAYAFARHVGVRLLLAALILALSDVAGLVAAEDGILAAAHTPSVSLTGTLYALVSYVIVTRGARAATRSAAPRVA